MHRIGASVAAEGGRIHLSFNRTATWESPFGLAGTFVALGDEQVGPLMFFLALPPGQELEKDPPHAHASDNWRITLKGSMPMGPDTYGTGEFRFQQGWKPYGYDHPAVGPEGGWTALMFADRRGLRMRHVHKATAPSSPQPVEVATAEWTGIVGDVRSDDPAEGSGPSALVTSFGHVRGSHLDGGFSAAGRWPLVADGTRAIAALLGDQERGPVLVLSTTDADRCSSPEFVVDTEVLRLVVDGSCVVGDRWYGAGDFWLQEAGVPSPGVIAGPGGLREVVVFGDRRRAVPSNISDGWTSALPSLIGELSARLQEVA